MSTKDINDVLEEVGRIGRYQWIFLTLMGLFITMFGFQMILIVFAHGTPQFRCTDEGFGTNSTTSEGAAGNETALPYYNNICERTEDVNGVNVTIACQSYEYDTSIFTSTIVTEFDLVCDRAQMVTWINMSWMVADAIGSLVGSYLSDRIGRKKLLLVAYFTMGVTGIGSAFAQGPVMYAVVRCIMASVCLGGFTGAIILCSEITAPTHRPHVVNILSIFWLAGTLLAPLCAFLIPNWRYLQLATTVGAFPVAIAAIWLVDESPHWLLIKGRPKEAYKVVQRLARFNKKEISIDFVDEIFVTKADDGNKSVQESCCVMWTHRKVTIRFWIFSFGWMACAFCYYALSLGVAGLPGSLHLNVFFMSAVEGLGYLYCFSIAWLGRKWTSVGCYFGGGASLLALAMITSFGPDSQGMSIAKLITSLIGKFCATACWQILFVWSSECYPTSNRCILMALNGILGRLGSTLAPFMLDLHKVIEVQHEEMIVPILYVAFMVLGGVLHLIPPETNNAKIPDSMAEANVKRFEVIGKKSSKNGSNEEPQEDDKFLEEIST